MSRFPKAGPLCSCGLRPPIPKRTLCRPCFRVVDAERSRARYHRERRPDSEDCNCGDSSCNGLRCEPMTLPHVAWVQRASMTTRTFQVARYWGGHPFRGASVIRWPALN